MPVTYALPDPLFVLLESGQQTKIVGAKRITRKPCLVWDKEMFRDAPDLVVGGAAGKVGAMSSDFTSVSNTDPIQIAGGVNPTITSEEITLASGDDIVILKALGASSVSESDAFNHLAKRYVPKLDTLIEFWDSELVGQEMTMDVTLEIGSAEIIVPDATELTPGQGISGTGIPTGSTILKIMNIVNGDFPDTTVAVMSKKATANGNAAATLTGGNKVGEVLQSEFISWGDENNTPD